MGRWNHESLIYGEFDTGSNNSNSSDSDDELILPKYDNWAEISSPTRVPPTPATWEPLPYGIPTICYCGQPAVLKTQTIGLLTGTKFYSCAGDIRVRTNSTLEFANLKEMETKVLRSDKEVNDLREMALQLQAKLTKLETDLKS
ncbi:unnamed protein product [Arabis nemorensis]|uniref:Uncharacterized protein n=1 Tax=Arabis nemorensis TaxID=586526 RepID=A0A565CF84_9BRAS|nr:unnamed protein product [Arabis nemorensis]